ncbi:ulp1 protease family, C-terminal catalytic domain-containing protein [Tanacetum coccineum]|uniref:Ulp1 protease family, C-terminal catalytic domain-containing protein n=1 Tax=Tanacetum coccineum TaxID=301880 RepID=A0ABQ5HEH0_9ASTR
MSSIVVPFQREKKLSKACLSPYVVQQPTTKVKCKKRRRNNNKKKSNKVIKSVFGPDGNEIPLFPWKEFTIYYAEGVKYKVPWFAKSVEKVYFPVNEKDFHWCLAELHIRSGVVTFYDSLGGPCDGIETRLFWLQLRQIWEFQILLYLEEAKVFEKKNIDKTNYLISFRYADEVPLQGGLYGDCSL